MEFTVLSHAGLLVKNSQHSLVCDPWLIGSCYWRSWWNYPPVSPQLIDSLSPDFIYLTHIHWDHFQGPSLRKLGKDKTIIVPKGNNGRMKKDLHKMGFHNVIELRHGQTHTINAHFKITSYQFGIFLDSALLIEVDGQKLLNLNDCKHMGPTLNQIVKKHAPIDFVFRSHSSANSRLCYEIIDDPYMPVDDIDSYIKGFADTVQATGAKYAIPFASNNCHLHPEVLKFNQVVQTPALVREYFEKNNIASPEVKVMLSGDSFNSDSGFEIAPSDWFSNREEKIETYAQEKQAAIENQSQKERRIGITREQMQNYFRKISRAMPFFVRRQFKDKPITFILTQGDKKHIFQVNLHSGLVATSDAYSDRLNPIQVHTSAFQIRQCIALGLFSHLSISKRVIYRTTKANAKLIRLMNLMFNFHEYDMLPWYKLFSTRSLETWCLRYREIWLYLKLAKDKLLTGKISPSKHLNPHATASLGESANEPKQTQA